MRYIYEQRRGSIAAEHVQKITFGSLKQGAVRPAHVVYLMGLDEDSFPRYEPNVSLCALKTSKEKPYIPLKADEDRYFLLELLCSVKKNLILSYTRIHPQDNKQQGPCLLIDELRVLRDIPIIEHASDACDASYFSLQAPVKNLNVSDYRLAHARYHGQVETRRFFNSCPAATAYPLITVSACSKLARHPVQFYLNEVLGLYLKEETDEEAAFHMSGLKQHALKRAALKSSLETVVERSQKEGVMPDGMFKDVAALALADSVSDLMSSLALFDLKKENIFSVELSVNCQQAVCLDNGNWIVPALKVGDHYLIGKLSDVTPRGYLVHAEKNTAKLMANWPLFVIYLNIKHHVGNFPATMLISKDGNKLEMSDGRAQQWLKEYLDYYALARCSVSPLMPEWTTAFFKGVEEFKKVLKKGKGPFSFSDPYLEWLERGEIALDAHEMHARWEPELKGFLPLLEKKT